MALLDNFKSFVRRIMKAVKGKVSEKDEKRLLRLFTRIRKKNRIISTAIISSLRSGGASEEEIQRLALLLERADHRLMNDKEPFNKKEEEEIKSIFKKTKIPVNVFYKLMYSLDELLSYEMNEAFIASKKEVDVKSVAIHKQEEHKKEVVKHKEKDKIKH